MGPRCARRAGAPSLRGLILALAVGALFVARDADGQPALKLAPSVAFTTVFDDNVFVTPAAYKSFQTTGTWPDKTMFVLEVRSAATKGSINNGGHFQDQVTAVEVEVKDEKRFPNKWAFFGFGASAASSKALPDTAGCQACHSANGAVDNTFVQFYPTLAPIAKAKGTFKTTP